MRISLTEALHQVNLEPGHVYRCDVGQLRVEVRVEQAGSSLPDPICESDIMLDAWTELPDLEPAFVVTAKPGPPLLPDPPDIPMGIEP